MKTLSERIEIMQACLDGKDIEVLVNGNNPSWNSAAINPDFNWTHCDYRIKLEPLTIWVNIYNDNEGNDYYAHRTKRNADNVSEGNEGLDRIAVKFIEVIE